VSARAPAGGTSARTRASPSCSRTARSSWAATRASRRAHRARATTSPTARSLIACCATERSTRRSGPAASQRPRSSAPSRPAARRTTSGARATASSCSPATGAGRAGPQTSSPIASTPTAPGTRRSAMAGRRCTTAPVSKIAGVTSSSCPDDRTLVVGSTAPNAVAGTARLNALLYMREPDGAGGRVVRLRRRDLGPPRGAQRRALRIDAPAGRAHGRGGGLPRRVPQRRRRGGAGPGRPRPARRPSGRLRRSGRSGRSCGRGRFHRPAWKGGDCRRDRGPARRSRSSSSCADPTRPRRPRDAHPGATSLPHRDAPSASTGERRRPATRGAATGRAIAATA
jgi:hypothetical protein